MLRSRPDFRPDVFDDVSSFERIYRPRFFEFSGFVGRRKSVRTIFPDDFPAGSRILAIR